MPYNEVIEKCFDCPNTQKFNEIEETLSRLNNVKPKKIELKNGVTRTVEIDDAIKEIWEIVMPLRDIGTAIQLYKRHKLLFNTLFGFVAFISVKSNVLDFITFLSEFIK